MLQCLICGKLIYTKYIQSSTLMDPHPLKYTYIQTVYQVSLLGFAALGFLIVFFVYFYVSLVTYYLSPSPHAICI